MKIFLTGVTGFIGSQVARLCISQGGEVYAAIRKNSNLWRIEDIIRRLNLTQIDLQDISETKKLIKYIRPDECIHMAWYVEPGKYLSAYENIYMLNTSLELAKAMADVGCHRFVGAGTCFEYGSNSECLSENSPVRPQTLYAACKLSLFTILEQVSKKTGMEVVWPRLFYLYGPYEAERRLVPSVICSLLRNQPTKTTRGEQVRDFLHVTDVASAIWAVSQSKLTGPVNIGSGRPVKIREIIEIVGKIMNKQELINFGALPYAPDEAMFICAENHRLLDNTDWTPQYDLETGLKETIAWWRKRLL